MRPVLLLQFERAVAPVKASELCSDCAWCGPADYEVDFIDYFTRLTGSKLGAKFVPDPYVVDSVLDIPKL